MVSFRPFSVRPMHFGTKSDPPPDRPLESHPLAPLAGQLGRVLPTNLRKLAEDIVAVTDTLQQAQAEVAEADARRERLNQES